MGEMYNLKTNDMKKTLKKEWPILLGFLTGGLLAVLTTGDLGISVPAIALCVGFFIGHVK